MAWATSPTRLREDGAAEADLVRAGYRDRVLTELAQNAADAAGVEGRLCVWCDGAEVHVANTGSPLSSEGVQSLSALRASNKRSASNNAAGVGKFGVGFSAVLAVSDEIVVRSSTGSVRFSATETRKLLVENSIEVTDALPVLRLVWPSADKPVDGWDTEIVLRLRDGVDVDSLLASMTAESTDLLLELTALQLIRIGDAEVARAERRLPNGVVEVTVGAQRWWQYCTPSARWLLPVVNGRARPIAADVLRAPTRSDEQLSIPAVVVATIDMQPDRRRIVPGARVDELASCYADFAAALPIADRLALVPEPGFALGPLDAELRDALLHELRGHAWLPVVGNAAAVPTAAMVIASLSTDLADLLADVVPNLVVPELSQRGNLHALSRLGVHLVGLARLSEMLGGLERPASWWQRLYTALEPLAVDTVAAEELGALPVPLADGRLVTGPRTTVVGTDLDWDGEIPVRWARLVHPVAAHSLLERLGAKQAAAVDLLSDPALQAAIVAMDGNDDELVGAVLAIAAHVTDPDALPGWLGLLPLLDDAGALRSADELLLPNAPLASVLVADSPFGTVDPALVARFGGIALRGVGVGWAFTVVRENFPTGPDHELDREEDWWAGLADDTEAFAAVRDLDLVDDDRWPHALTLLAHDEQTRPLLADRSGYTAWWLRRNVRVDGQLLGTLTSPDEHTFTGLLDPLDHPDAAALGAVTIDPAELDPDVVQVLLDRLADPDRSPSPGVVAAVHALLASVVGRGVIDVADVLPPERIRTLAGVPVDPAVAMVIDNQWIARVVPYDVAVLGSIDTAAALADLLDIRLASDAVHGDIISTGEPTMWGEVPSAVAAFVTQGLPMPSGAVVQHENLTVRLTGSITGERTVPWWRDDDGLDHIGWGVR